MMMTRISQVIYRLGWVSLLVAAATFLGEYGAWAKIDISGGVVVGAQAVDFDSTTGNLDEDFNFNDPRINLGLKAKISEKITLSTMFWAGNDWNHENIRGNAGTVALDNDVEFRATVLTLKDVAGSGVDLKIGKIFIPYGHEAPKRVAHGDMSKSDFVSNSLLDINGIDDGLALSGSFEMENASAPLSWEIAVFNGGAVTDGNPVGTAGQSRSNDDLGYALRIQSSLRDNLTLQASWYQNDLSADGDNDALHVGSSFFVNAVQDGTAANKNLVGLVYAGGGQGGGYDRDFWEVSAKYDFDGGSILGFWGEIDADTSTSGASRKWSYAGVQGRYAIDPSAYVAARWNWLAPDYAGSDALGEPTLISIAGGYQLAENAWLKAEWTAFDEDGAGFSNEGTAVGAASRADARDADATAVRLALGVGF